MTQLNIGSFPDWGTIEADWKDGEVTLSFHRVASASLRLSRGGRGLSFHRREFSRQRGLCLVGGFS